MPVLSSASFWLLLMSAAVLFVVIASFRRIGPSEVGLVRKRYASGALKDDNPVALRGEAGYQADLLMPGLRWRLWPVYSVDRRPWVQVPAGEIGVVIAQVGQPLPIGAKSAVYKKDFGNFTNLRTFIEMGGQKGVQRPVLPPGTLVPIHPVGFLVITKREVYGVPISPEIKAKSDKGGQLSPEVFGLRAEQLDLVRIEPRPRAPGGPVSDMVGIVTVYQGQPLPSGDIAGRLGGFQDLEAMEAKGADDLEMIERLLGSKNELHNNYQDYQAFMDAGGRIGLQHDTLLYGAYALNPFLVSVEMVPDAGGQPGRSGRDQSLCRPEDPGHVRRRLQIRIAGEARPSRHVATSPPHGQIRHQSAVLPPEIVPTSILTLNWADAIREAHNLDKQLKQIIAKSRKASSSGSTCRCRSTCPTPQAPRVISMVGTMSNLVNEVLQAAVGNHFRDKLQSMPAVRSSSTRQSVQQEAYEHIRHQLREYEVETKGVYIQDVVLPVELVQVLTQREIANQEIQTFQKQREAQTERITMENAKGMADQQSELARSKVGVEIKANNADARKAEADGEAEFIRRTGAAQGAEVEAVGLARAKALEATGLARARGYEAQVSALGQGATTAVNVINALAEGGVHVMPEVLVTGGGSGGGGALEGLAATLIRFFGRKEADKNEGLKAR